MFQRDRTAITKHIKNVFAENEVEEKAICNICTLQILTGQSRKPIYVANQFRGAKPKKSDITVAKNYLTEDEINILNRIVSAYLEFAELQAIRKIPMHMSDWIKRLDDFNILRRCG